MAAHVGPSRSRSGPLLRKDSGRRPSTPSKNPPLPNPAPEYKINQDKITFSLLIPNHKSLANYVSLHSGSRDVLVACESAPAFQALTSAMETCFSGMWKMLTAIWIMMLDVAEFWKLVSLEQVAD